MGLVLSSVGIIDPFLYFVDNDNDKTGKLAYAGDTDTFSMDGSLTLTGDINAINGDLSGDLDVVGDADVTGTLDVNGETYLSTSIYADNITKEVLIGENAGSKDPLTDLEVSFNGGGLTRGLTLSMHNAGAGASPIWFAKSTGTRASPTIVGSSDIIGSIYSRPYDGTGYNLLTAGIQFIVNGSTPSANNVPTDIAFLTNSSNANSVERMRLTSAGRFGIGTTNPTHELNVDGDVNITGDLLLNGQIDSTNPVILNQDLSYTAITGLLKVFNINDDVYGGILTSYLGFNTSDTKMQMVVGGVERWYVDIFGNSGILKNLIVGGDLNVTGNITADYVNSKNYVIQYHRNAIIDTTSANTWVNVTWDLLIDEETTSGYSLADSDVSIIIEHTGIYRVQGCLHPKNNGVGNQEASLYSRILIDGMEAKCLQYANNKEFKSSGIDTMAFTGTLYAQAGQKVQLQYYITNLNIDFEGDAVFDDGVAGSINFERISD